MTMPANDVATRVEQSRHGCACDCHSGLRPASTPPMLLHVSCRARQPQVLSCTSASASCVALTWLTHSEAAVELHLAGVVATEASLAAAALLLRPSSDTEVGRLLVKRLLEVAAAACSRVVLSAACTTRPETILGNESSVARGMPSATPREDCKSILGFASPAR